MKGEAYALGEQSNDLRDRAHDADRAVDPAVDPAGELEEVAGDREQHAPDEGPVTVIVSRRIKPEYQDEFEEWLQGILAEATRFQGHQGVNVLRPADPACGDYVIIFRFDTYAHMQAWEESPVRAEWLERVRPYTQGKAEVKRVTGLEYWFAPPRGAADPSPPPLKMVLVTVLGIYPLVMLLLPRLEALFKPYLPGPLLELANSIILVAMMTYVVMPLLTRAMTFWLYPAKTPKES